MTTTTAKKEDGALAWASDYAPKNCQEVSSLYGWSTNYSDFAPFRKFLDLIGYSEENFEVSLADWTRPADSLGFMELAYLADALNEYASNPLDVERFIAELLEIEGEFGL
jgi:hypothetical protein